MKYKPLTEVEFKGIIQVITQQTKELLSIKPFRSKIEESLRIEYLSGIEKVDKQLKPVVNTAPPRNLTRQLEALYNYVEQNLQDHVNVISSKLRQEVQRGLLNDENKVQIIQRVRAVFTDDKQVINRLKTVIRTETSRANTQGQLEAAKQAEINGMKLKKWLQVVPYRKGVSSPFCNTPNGKSCKNCASGKYGNPKEAIKLSENFVLKDKNKTVRAQGPPFHPNCRTTLRIDRIEDLKETKEFTDKEIKEFQERQ